MGLCGQAIGVGLIGGLFFPLLLVVAIIGGVVYMIMKKKETEN